MAFYDKFPYTNFQEINLDSLIKAVNDLKSEVENYIEINSIEYANPLLWDITSQYEKNTVVLDRSGNAYLSVQAVPAGINLNNTDYWTEIGNFSELWRTIKDSIAPYDEGLSTTASGPRQPYDLVWLDNVLYIVTAPMIAGDSYVTGSNCEQTTIQDIINTLRGNITQAVEDLETELDQEVGTINQTIENNYTTLNNKIDTRVQDTFDTLKALQISRDIRDYGAVIDGVTDDSAALNQALAENRYVYLPEGSYYFGQQIQMHDGNVLFAVAKGTVIINYSPDIDLFKLAYNNRFQNLIIETNSGDNYAFIGNDSSLINIFNCDNLGGSFHLTRSRFIKVTGTNWHTVMIYNCIVDCGATTGYACVFEGNPANVRGVNADLHICQCFIDTVLMEDMTGGTVSFRDLYGPSIEYSLIRSTLDRRTVAVYTTQSGQIGDLWLGLADIRVGKLYIDANSNVWNSGYASVIENHGQYHYGFPWQRIDKVSDAVRFGNPTLVPTYNGAVSMVAPMGTQNVHALHGVQWNLGNYLNGMAHIKIAGNLHPGNKIGIGVKSANNSGIDICGIGVDADSLIKMCHNRYTSLSTSTDTYYSGIAPNTDLYLRFRITSGHITYEVSSDGDTWVFMFQTTLNFTATQMCIAIDTYLVTEYPDAIQASINAAYMY